MFSTRIAVAILLIGSHCWSQDMGVVRRRTAASAPVNLISYVGGCSGTTSCTPPTHQSGDLFIAFVGRNSSSTAPTLPAGWTSVSTPSINGAGSADSVVRIACKVAAGASETVTGFTNGGSLVTHVYRGTEQVGGGTCATDILGTPQNFTSTVDTTTTTATYNAVTSSDSTSWIAGFGYAPAATAGLSTAPTGMSNRTSNSTTAAGHDTNASASSFSSTSVTTTTAGRIITSTFEILVPRQTTPTDSPGAGTYGSTQSVTLSSASADQIRYTTDGSTPTCSVGTVYSGAISVAATTTIKAIACRSGYRPSNVLTSTYTISAGAAAFDAVSNGKCNDAAAPTCTSGTTLTFSHTTGSGSNRALDVFCAVSGGSGTVQPAISSVTHAGSQSLSEVATSGTNYRIRHWALPNGTQPTSGTNNIVVVLASVLGDTNSTLSCSAISSSSVDQTTQFTDSGDAASGNSTSASWSMTTSGANDLGLVAVCNGTSVGGISTGTVRFDAADDTNGACNTLGVATIPGGTTSGTWTVGSDSWLTLTAVKKGN